MEMDRASFCVNAMVSISLAWALTYVRATDTCRATDKVSSASYGHRRIFELFQSLENLERIAYIAERG